VTYVVVLSWYTCGELDEHGDHSQATDNPVLDTNPTLATATMEMPRQCKWRCEQLSMVG